MAWHTKMNDIALDDVRMALSTLAHHKFFESYAEGLTEFMLGAIPTTKDENLVQLMRKYQSHQELIQELAQVAANEASHLAIIDGDDNV